MTFNLHTQSRLLDLHCSVGLTDWDMDQELKLATTTDQFCHDDNLGDQYMMQRTLPSQRKDDFIWYDETSEPAAGRLNHQDRSEEPQIPLTCSLVGEQQTSSPQDNKSLKPGCWPRPPVNYYILIALALKSSHNGSLKVQQIYNFTREQFPFFQTAPDGWKNTIRHNLCFNSSFRKTCNQMCRDGKRKSCFWYLTLEGQRRLENELRMLPAESLKQLERSMSHPDIIGKVLETRQVYLYGIVLIVGCSCTIKCVDCHWCRFRHFSFKHFAANCTCLATTHSFGLAAEFFLFFISASKFSPFIFLQLSHGLLKWATR
ncbi:forkhead box protein R1 isoform X2 [Syngnathus scovelli]|uniref:forkhead box protein R1 isoform X2 n=1 Tax=Syngnathus scovelli TaxID=161590 RepID=UPI00210F28F6|nr:forkhead box protein R1 [Syngnathus scovelli]